MTTEKNIKNATFNNNLTFKTSKLKGTVNAPSSKSLTHRAIICAALSRGKSTISNISYSDDIYATIEAVKQLGASVHFEENSLTIYGIEKTDVNLTPEIYSNESASTLRFIIPITLRFYNAAKFTAEKGLVKRPLDVYFNIFNEQGIKHNYIDDDLHVTGKIKSGEFYIDGSISSQFVSGLLFTLPLLHGDSTIYIKGDLQSKSYVALTLDVLKHFGINVENSEYRSFRIKGNQKYYATDYTVEGDYSQTSVFEIANYLGHDINILNTNPKSLQGDAIILENIKKFLADSDITIDGSNCPDIVPIMALGACFRKYKTSFINIERLRIKECDRLKATYEVLSKLGAEVEITESSMLVHGHSNFKGGLVLDSYNDHRIAMLITIASTMCDEAVILTNPNCISKSYPNFYEVFKSLGGEVHE